MISTSVLGSCSFMMLHTSIICCVGVMWFFLQVLPNMDHLVCPPWSVSYFILWSVFLVNTFFIWRDWLPIHRVHRLKHISLSCDNILNSVKLWYESVMDGCHLWMVVIIWRFLLEIRNYFSGPFSNIFFRFWYTETYINPNDLICFYWLNLMTCSLDICIITTSKLLCQNCLTIVFFLSYNNYSYWYMYC
jgi:hypothetical protein